MSIKEEYAPVIISITKYILRNGCEPLFAMLLLSYRNIKISWSNRQLLDQEHPSYDKKKKRNSARSKIVCVTSDFIGGVTWSTCSCAVYSSDGCDSLNLICAICSSGCSNHTYNVVTIFIKFC